MTRRGRTIVPAAITAALLLTSGCGQGGRQPDGSPKVDPSASPKGAAPAAFAVCAACHSVEPGQNRIGPSLAGVWGRKAASGSDFDYSPALKNAGIVWDEATLDRWLRGPVQMVPGTKMVIGISDPRGRQEVIAYLKTLK